MQQPLRIKGMGSDDVRTMGNGRAPGGATTAVAILGDSLLGEHRRQPESAAGAGAQIVLNHTYNTYDSEPAWGQCAQFVPVFSATVQNWLPAGDITPLDNTTLRLNGVHSHLTTIVDTVINETGAPARMPLGIHCLVT